MVCMASSKWRRTASAGGPWGLRPTSTQNFNLTSRAIHTSASASQGHHMMDPLSITTSCIALASCLAKTSSAVIGFTRDARNANKDMDAISAELQALAAILNPFTTSLHTLTAVPETLVQRVDTILIGCRTVVDQIDKQLTKYTRNKVFGKIGWVLFGQSDMQKLRDSLMGYKTALNLGIQIISMYVLRLVSQLHLLTSIRSASQVVKDDTMAIREQNEALMLNVDTILAQLKGIQAAKSSRSHKRIKEWIDDLDALTSYAETTYAETYARSVYTEAAGEPAADDPTTSSDQSTDLTIFKPVYQQGDPGEGIGGYNLRSIADRCFALDYNSTGKLDHLVPFRPGIGMISVLQNTAGIFTHVYQSISGIATYDILDPCDRALAFDYTSNGHLDHIVFYRPGHRIIYVIRRSQTDTFTTVLKSHDGIGGYDLASSDDRIFAFDYDHSGKQDHLVIYRPGAGIFCILRNDGHDTGTFTPVYCTHQGVGHHRLASRHHDRAFAFDWDGTGMMDYVALYRPGDAVFSVVKIDNGTLTSVWTSPGQGLGHYNLADHRDTAFAYDWAHTGRRDHVALYRPGTGTFWVVARDGDDGWKPVFHEGDPGRGVGGFDLMSYDDNVFAFDYGGGGKMDHLVAYRKNGTGTIWILKHV